MALVVVGTSHRTAPIEVRERFALASSEIAPALARLRDEGAAREAAVLTTCNRTEFYVVEDAPPENDAASPARVAELLAERIDERVDPYLYVRRDRDAARHLFRVASGLDSMIVGEAQIHGQVRDAWERSREHAGAVLNRLFQCALLVGGRVRTETAIGRGAASVSSAAVQLAKKIFGSLHGRSAMVLGAGEMAELALECLVREGVRATIVANRTYERAEELARRHGATALHYDQCWPRLAQVDVVICSTAAPHAVVFPEHVKGALAARGDHPLCILDIALPRDVDPSVGRLDNVFLYDLDDLRAVVAASLERRQSELPTAEQLIDAEVERYWQWLAGLAAVPVLTRFRSEMERVRAEELAQALRKLGDLTPAQREAVEYLSRSLMNKFLHAPSVRLRAAAANGGGLGIVDAVRYLFALDDVRPAASDRGTPGPRSEESDHRNAHHAEDL